MTHRNLLLIICLLLVLVAFSIGQSLTQRVGDETTQRAVQAHFNFPMRITPVLSGNFGEIRSNHFHSGLDFKTEKRTGIPVYAVADGWISRIRISAYGFGYALYIDHPSGYTSVYGHLDRYAYPIDSLAMAAQYSIESFELDSLYQPKRFPVKAGQLIAYSGTSGLSTAPHLHFEIRDTRSEDVLDPLIWYGESIPDKQAPRIRQITLFAANNQGIIQGNRRQYAVSTIQQQDGSWVIKDSFPSAFGTLGLGIKAYDYMDNTTNTYGVWSIKLYKNDTLLYSRQMDRFAYSDTRYVNATIDYNDWQRNNSIVMRSYLLPGNQWPHAFAIKRGLFTLNKGEISHFRYELSDRKGNTTTLHFTLKGASIPIPAQHQVGQRMAYALSNVWEENGIRLELPKGALYEDLFFTAGRTIGNEHADIFRLHDSGTPIHMAVPLSIRIKSDTVTRKSRYYLARKNTAGKWLFAGSGTYKNGWLTTPIKEFGTYTVLTDKTPPKITPIDSNNAVKNRLFRIRVSDDASGVVSWRGTIDGKWVLFTFNIHSGELRYAFDDSRLSRNGQHSLMLTVTDACGNTQSFNHSFYY